VLLSALVPLILLPDESTHIGKYLAFVVQNVQVLEGQLQTVLGLILGVVMWVVAVADVYVVMLLLLVRRRRLLKVVRQGSWGVTANKIDIIVIIIYIFFLLKYISSTDSLHLCQLLSFNFSYLLFCVYYHAVEQNATNLLLMFVRNKTKRKSMSPRAGKSKISATKVGGYGSTIQLLGAALVPTVNCYRRYHVRMCGGRIITHSNAHTHTAAHQRTHMDLKRAR